MKHHCGLLVLLLASCGSGQAPVQAPPASEPVASPVAAEEPPVQVPEPDPPPPGTPHVTFEQLMEGTLEPGTVILEAYLAMAFTPPTCSEKKDCKPCVEMSVLADDRPGTNPARVWVQGLPAAHEKMWKLVPYLFVLEIVEGYGEMLGNKSCHPGETAIMLKDCVGCEELPVPLVTLADLREEKLEPGFVKLEAYFVQASTPKPCPKKHKCQPCGTTTLIAEDPDDPATEILVLGHPPSVYKLDKDKPYTFVLDLREGYEEYLDH
ncbi:MAG: hypothetical protein JRG91_01935, partial [Deltaproteobacteria bacterium]|nr:hypothetical protein [Deltaproteobacteria bacterium]